MTRGRLLSPRTFRIEWEAHAWVGVVASLFAFIICFFGIFAVFRESFLVWQDPALHVTPVAEVSPTSFDAALAAVERTYPVASSGELGLVRHRGTRLLFAYTSDPTTGAAERLWVDPVAGTVLRERTGLAEELFAMHFFYRFPGGFEFSGVVAVALLFALVGGLLIHLKDLRRQAWQFRPEKKLRVSASDAHKVLGIFGLPFSLVLSWSGAILCLAGLVTQGLATTTFHGNVRQVQELRGHSQPERPPTHREAAMLSMDSIVRRAQELYATDDAPDFVALERRRDESAWVGVSFPTHASRDFGVRRYLAFDGVTGQPLSDADARQTPAHRFEKVMMDLHFGRYGGRFVEVLYALLALALCAVILTGNIIWLERRDAKRSRLGNRVLARLTAGVSAGAVAASAAYFAVNRVLPWRLEGRVTTELRVFFLAWAAAIASAFLVRRSARDVTSWLLFAAALLFGAVVIADVARFDANVLTALARGLPDVFVAELVLISLALGSTVLGATLRASRKCSPTKASNASASCSA